MKLVNIVRLMNPGDFYHLYEVTILIAFFFKKQHITMKKAVKIQRAQVSKEQECI